MKIFQPNLGIEPIKVTIQPQQHMATMFFMHLMDQSRKVQLHVRACNPLAHHFPAVPSLFMARLAMYIS